MSCVLYRFCLKKQEGKALSIHVALIDKSEVICKMISHCLYYHTVQVHRFDSFEDYLANNDKKPSLIFIDWEIKQGDRPLIFTAIEQVHSVPFVLIYRKDLYNEVLTVPKNQIPHRIRKPLNPKEVRDVCTGLIPELKSSAFHTFLKFPKSAEEKKQEQDKSAPAPTPPKQKDLAKEPEDKGADQTKSFIGSLIEKTGLFKMPSSEEIEAAEESSVSDESADSSLQTKTGLASVSSLSSKNENKTIKQSQPEASSQGAYKKTVKTTGSVFADKKTETTKQTLSQNLGSLAKQLKEAGSVTQGTSKESSFDLNSKIVKKPVKTFNKDDIDIDEDTQNDLAPMAIKSPSSVEKKSESKTLIKQDIQRAFDKYKDSLGFQKMMERTLSEHVQVVVAKVLKGESVNNILQKSLADFKESDRFKQLVEKEISQYLQKQLPLLIKTITEKEIKKIIGD